MSKWIKIFLFSLSQFPQNLFTHYYSLLLEVIHPLPRIVLSLFGIQIIYKNLLCCRAYAGGMPCELLMPNSDEPWVNQPDASSPVWTILPTPSGPECPLAIALETNQHSCRHILLTNINTLYKLKPQPLSFSNSIEIFWMNIKEKICVSCV